MDQAYCEALRFAIEYEQSGEDYYRKAVDEAQDRFAKKALVFLADEEIEHIGKIERFNDSLLGRGDFDIDAECLPTLPERLNNLIASAKSDEKSQTSSLSDSAVYDLAMATEKQGFEMYNDFREDSPDQRIKQFFGWLADEEIVHYKLLAESKKYLEDQSYYFEEDGGWIFG